MEAVNITESGPRLRGRLTVLVVVAMVVATLVALRLSATDDPVRFVTTGNLPSVPTTTPEPPKPVDPTTLENGWYLAVPTKIITTEDGPLLAAAQEVLVQAIAVGYGDAKIVPNPGSASECGDWGCIDGTPPMGYMVLLKGPYPTPSWPDLDAKFAWHQELQAQEQNQAGVAGLLAKPALEFFTFQ